MIAPPVPDLIHELITRPIPKQLWHYTSYKGFQGIVESKAIFASDLRYLNDSQEFVHAKELAVQLAEEAANVLDGERAHETIKNAVKTAFDSGLLQEDHLQIMVASFSASPDQLSQWRGYSGGSSGVSISFDCTALRPPQEAMTSLVFAPCVYKDTDKRALLKQVLAHVLSVVHQWAVEVAAALQDNPKLLSTVTTPMKPSPPHVVYPDLPTMISRIEAAVKKANYDLLRICPLLKHESFSEECEWRIALPISVEKHLPIERRFRATHNTIIPYLSLALCDSGDALPINAITLGPGSHQKAIEATSAFLRANHLSVIPKRSDVPYRAT